MLFKNEREFPFTANLINQNTKLNTKYKKIHSFQNLILKT